MTMPGAVTGTFGEELLMISMVMMLFTAITPPIQDFLDNVHVIMFLRV